MSNRKPQNQDRLARLSLPVSVADALKGAMETPPPDDDKPKKRKKAKKRPKRKK